METLKEWGPILAGIAVSLGLVTMLVTVWKRGMEWLRVKIRTTQLVENEHIEAFIDRLALRAVDYAEKLGEEYIRSQAEGNKMTSTQKREAAINTLKAAAARIGVPIDDRDAEEHVEEAHSAMKRAANFPVAAALTSASGSVTVVPEPNSD